MPSTLRGLPEMKSRLQQIATNFPDRVGSALYLEAQIEMTESKRRVPVDTGVLRSTGSVSEPMWDRNKVSVIMSYGGAASEYAIIVHEDLEAHHTIGQAKYLESVLNESVPFMLRRIGARLQLG